MKPLIQPMAFGVLSRSPSGQYEVFIEDDEEVQYRFQFSFDELVELSEMALAVVPEDRR